MALLLGTLLILFCVSVSSSDIITLTDETIDQVATGTWFVKFYAPWCGHWYVCLRRVLVLIVSTRMQPAFQNLASSGTGVNVAELDCTVHKQGAARFQIRGYPTLKFFKDGIEIPYESGDRGLTAMQDFITGTNRDYEISYFSLFSRGLQSQNARKTHPTSESH